MNFVQSILKPRKKNAYPQGLTKTIVVILLWNFSSSLTYSLLFHPSSILQLVHIDDAIEIIGTSMLLFLLSPLAGYLADVKVSRYKALMYSSYMNVFSLVLLLLIFSLIVSVGHSVDHIYKHLLIVFLLTVILVGSGRVVFLANILQFGTDQLRDAPTRCSVLFLYAFLWCEDFCQMLVLTTNLPGHKVILSLHHYVYTFDKVREALIMAVFTLSVVSSLAILLFLGKKKSFFYREALLDNPYKLVTGVIVFSMRHKVPIRRSAFTYCENEQPSRLDFGKRKYGGPFTTEQVEDVKVFFGMMKILFLIGPTFMLDIVSTISVISHPKKLDSENESLFKLMLLDYGMMCPVITLVCVPVYLFLLKPFLSRHGPNMFKRIGFSTVTLIISLLLFLLFDILSSNTSERLGHVYALCKNNSDNYILEKSIISIPSTYMFISQHVLLSISHILLYIGAWEFICCQSPQHMKGLIFGLFFAIRALFQFLGIALLSPFLHFWRSRLARCQFGYYLLNISVGLVSLILYTLAARKYKYRKRDDIVNIYQYAEEYYTKYGSYGIMSGITSES